MTKQQRVNVFLILRDPRVCRTSAEGLTDAGYNVTEYQTAREFLIDRRNHQRGVVLSDMRLLGSLGTDLAEQLSGEKATFPVILIVKAADIPKAVRAGIDFVCGPTSVFDLQAAIERTLNTESFREKWLRWAFDNMSPRELEVLAKVAAGMSSRDIGKELGISTKTVEAHRARINGKTRAKDVGELIRMWKAWQELQ